MVATCKALLDGRRRPSASRPTSPRSGPAGRSATRAPAATSGSSGRPSPTAGWASTSARAARPTSPTSCSMPAPCSGTARWACSRTLASRPARAPSPRPSPSPMPSRWSAAATRRRRSPSSASPIASTTSAPVAERRSSSSSRATCPACEALRSSSGDLPVTDRKPLISGNWKMHHNHFEALQLVQKLSYLLDEADYDAVDVSVHPPFTDLRTVQTYFISEKDRSRSRWAPRHCHCRGEGRLHRRGGAADARQARRALRHRRALRAARAVRRDRRGR